MSNRTKMSFLTIALVAGVALPRGLPCEQKPAWMGYAAVREVLGGQRPASGGGVGMGMMPMTPATMPAGDLERYYQPLREALLSADPEGALIEILRSDKWRWPGAARLLGEGGVGKERAAQALREFLDRMVSRYPTDPGAPLVSESIWYAQDLNGYAAEEQVKRISDGVESLITSAAEVNYKRTIASAAVTRLADLGVKEGLPILLRMYDANKEFFEKGKKDDREIGRPGNWFPFGAAVRLIDVLDDPSCLPLLEPAVHPFHFGGDIWGWQSVGAIWWRLSLKGLDEGQRVAFLARMIVGPPLIMPQVAQDGLRSAARMVGPASLPEMRRIAFDDGFDSGARNCARIVLAELRDTDSILSLRAVATNPAVLEDERYAAVHYISKIGGVSARDALFQIAQAAVASGDRLLAGSALGGLWYWCKMPPPTDEQAAFARALLNDPTMAPGVEYMLRRLEKREFLPE